MRLGLGPPRDPRASAIYSPEDQTSVTYGELSNSVSVLAAYLANVDSVCIAVAMPPCVAGIVAELAVMAARKTYCPVDTRWPRSRLDSVLSELDIRCILVEKGSPLMIEHCVVLDARTATLLSDPPHTQQPQDAHDPAYAYVMATSGTAGAPRMVGVSHSVAARNVEAVKTRLGIANGDRVVLASQATFDPSICELFCTLDAGACLIVLSRTALMSPRLCMECLHTATVLMCTPSFYSRIEPSKLPNLRVIVLGGEPVPSIPPHPAGTRFFQLYGVTECSIWATSSDGVDLGVPLDGTEVRVVDVTSRDVLWPGSADCLGEIEIGGEGRVCHVFDVDDEDWWRTGDLGEVRGGKLFFAGRTDRQFKRNGQTVNPELVAQLISSHPDVIQCHVVFTEPDQTLHAFVVGQADIAEHCRTLPDHMRPDRTCHVPQMPLTSHGKVDEAALLQTVVPSRRSAPVSSGVECLERVRAAWAEELPLDVAITNDSWFLALGGSSIGAVRVARSIADDEGLAEVIRVAVIDMPLAGVAGVLRRSHASSKRQRTTVPPNRRLLIDSRERLAVMSPGNRTQWHGTTQRAEASSPFPCPSDLSICWSFNFEKCIDASPLVVATWKGDIPSSVVFIGSHSGWFGAIDGLSGTLVWRVDLKSRIEATAGFSIAHGCVLVGSNDQHVTCLDAASGDIRWTYETMDAVKGQPRVSGDNVWCVCHDGCVHVLDVASGGLVGRVPCGGIIRSAVEFDPISPNRVYVCCSSGARGSLISIHKMKVVWRLDFGGPVLSSPCVGALFVFVGCCDGNIYAASKDKGEVVWSFPTNGPVFCTPTALLGSSVAVTSNDGFCYCLSQSDGACLWSCDLGGAAMASPCTLIGLDDGMCQCVVAATSKNRVVLIEDSRVVADIVLPAPVFSSPVGVCWITDEGLRGRVFVGCRDDCVYGLGLSIGSQH